MFHLQNYRPEAAELYFDIDDSRFTDETIQRVTIEIDSSAPTRYVVLHNSVPRERETVVEFLVTTPHVKVASLNGTSIVSQIGVTWMWKKDQDLYLPKPSHDTFRLLFKAWVPPLGLATYVIRLSNPHEISEDM